MTENLRLLKNELGLTQNVLAGKVGTSRQIVNATGRAFLASGSIEESLPLAQTATATVEQPNNAICRVDFDHTELCTNCDPVTCTVNGEPVPVGTWRDLLVNLVEMFIAKGNPNINNLCNKPLLSGSKRPFLLKDLPKEKPNGKARQIRSGNWINVNFNIAILVDIIGKLCRYCGVSLDNVEITYTPKANGGMAERNMTHNNAGSSLQNSSDSDWVRVPHSVVAVLSEDYSGGFRFDATALRLLSNKVGVEIDGNMQSTLKRQMFRRNDDVYFLLDLVVDAETRKDIVGFADALLDEYGCFEIPELYARYADRLNPKCIGSVEDFENFYERISRRDVRCVAAPQIGNRIARYINGNVWEIFSAIAQKIIAVTNGEFGGVISEDDLHRKFRAFSVDLLAKIIRYCVGDKLLRVEINGIVCYQTLDALGLPEDFSDTLSGTLCRLDDLGLTPNEETLHTALSLALGVNLKSEYNIPGQTAFRQLVDVYYKADPPRKWKYGVFGEAAG
jgi:DNA-binding XRE family transcriptional regulator